MAKPLSAAWRAAIEQWHTYAIVAGFTAGTRRRRRRWLADIASASDISDPWRATTSGLEAALIAARLAPVATRDARGALRHFYAWGCASGRIGHDPARPMTAVPPPPFVAPDRPAVHVRSNRGRRTETPPLNEDWTVAVRLWTDYTLAGGRSSGTVRTRAHYLAHLAQSCPDPWLATPEQLLRFLAVPQWSAETRKSARGAVRAFYRWAALAGHVETDPARALPAVRVPAGTPRPAPVELVEDARAAATETERLMVDLACRLGLRRSEVARVHTHDVEGPNLRVHGKGGKERLLPLPTDLRERIQARPAGYVFPTHTGRPVSAWVVGDALSALLGDGWSGHSLRHRAGTDFYERTGDILVTSKLLGHAKPETAAIYAQVPDDLMRLAVR